MALNASSEHLVNNDNKGRSLLMGAGVQDMTSTMAATLASRDLFSDVSKLVRARQLMEKTICKQEIGLCNCSNNGLQGWRWNENTPKEVNACLIAATAQPVDALGFQRSDQTMLVCAEVQYWSTNSKRTCC